MLVSHYLTCVRGHIVSLQESVTGQIDPPAPGSTPPGLHSKGSAAKDRVPPSDLHVPLQALHTEPGQGDVGGAGAGDQGGRELHRHPGEGGGGLVLQYGRGGVDQKLGNILYQLTDHK